MPPEVLNGSKGAGGRGGKDEDKQLAMLRAVVARVDALVFIFKTYLTFPPPAFVRKSDA